MAGGLLAHDHVVSSRRLLIAWLWRLSSWRLSLCRRAAIGGDRDGDNGFHRRERRVHF